MFEYVSKLSLSACCDGSTDLPSLLILNLPLKSPGSPIKMFSAPFFLYCNPLVEEIGLPVLENFPPVFFAGLLCAWYSVTHYAFGDVYLKISRH